jgi:cell division protein FtsB
MRWLTGLLLILLVLLQYRLWVGDGGLSDVRRLRHAVQQQKLTNEALRERNQALAGEVKDLKHGLDAIEERARTELGMVKQGETFYQVVEGGKGATPQARSDHARGKTANQ